MARDSDSTSKKAPRAGAERLVPVMAKVAPSVRKELEKQATRRGYRYLGTYLAETLTGHVRGSETQDAVIADGVAKLLREVRVLNTKYDALYHVFVSFVRLYLGHTPEIPEQMRPTAGAKAQERLERFFDKAAKDYADNPALVARLLDFIARDGEMTGTEVGEGGDESMEVGNES